MKVIRQIVYESESQEALDRQLFNSAGDGMKQFFRSYNDKPLTVGVMITVRTLYDDRVKVDEFPDETAKAIAINDAGLPPCQYDNCKKVRASRAIQASIDIALNGIAQDIVDEYRPTTQDESETTEGCN